MNKIIYFILLFYILLFSGCGDKQQGKSRINDFMKQNMMSDNYDVDDFSNLDSTFYVTDSLISQMHIKAETNSIFKRNLKYVPRTHKLFFMKVRYKLDGKQYSQTFYLDSALTGIVSFKNDQ